MFVGDTQELALDFEYVPGDGDIGGAYLSKFNVHLGAVLSFR